MMKHTSSDTWFGWLPRHFVLLGFVVFCSLPLVVDGQEKPSILIPTYSTNRSLSVRQDVCDRNRQYDRGEVEFRLALEGLQLHPILSVDIFFNLDEDGAIDEANPGLLAVLMDELAIRGGFTWRQSFGVYQYNNGPGVNHTWTELLLWSTEFYDVSVEWWSNTLDRLKMGVIFPEGFYDASIILVGKKEGEDDGGSINFWGWLEPFEGGVWALIVATTFVSGFVYQILDYVGAGEAETATRDLRADGIGEGIFLSSLLFTQHFQFRPRTPASRIFAASMALWALLISATYTANLASFFVIKNTPKINIQSIDDAIQAGLGLCVWDTTPAALYVERTYPKAMLVRKSSEVEIYNGVNTGECALAVTGVSSFLGFEKDKQANSECNLVWVGRVVQFVPAGFATKSDSGKLCTSLIHDVLNLHLVEMKADGFIDQAWADHLSKSQDVNCDAKMDDTDNDSNSRSVKEMAGTFVLHYVLTGVAIMVCVLKYMVNKYPHMPGLGRGVVMSAGQKNNGSGSMTDVTNIVGGVELEDVLRREDELAEALQRRQEMEGSLKTQLRAILNLLEEGSESSRPLTAQGSSQRTVLSV